METYIILVFITIGLCYLLWENIQLHRTINMKNNTIEMLKKANDEFRTINEIEEFLIKYKTNPDILSTLDKNEYLKYVQLVNFMEQWPDDFKEFMIKLKK